MKIKLELLKNYISDFINNRIEDFEINADEIADTAAIDILEEIQNIIKNDTLTDFEIVEEIISVFEKHNIDYGTCHDF